MKKKTTICTALFALFVSNAQVTAVRCTENDYNKAMRSIILCDCMPIPSPKLSPDDSIRVDNILRYTFLTTDGFDEPQYELWRDKDVLQRKDNKVYIVGYGPELKESGDPAATGRTAFFDTLFQPRGSIVGDGAVFDCCASHIATSEWRLDEPPILHLYHWENGNALPKEIGQYAPNDFVVEEYCWDGGILYVKGYALIDELYKGDTLYMRISVEE
ncbi:MAG: hypothetical protein K6E93_06140 [Bacteroidales bacterium]|nr:hypothetical protein [Bacteroidales bacterium]